MKRLLGVDYGTRRIGLALSDPLGITAQPLGTVAVERPGEGIGEIARIVAEKEVGEVVVGLPRRLDGSLGPAAEEVLRFAEALRGSLAVPVATWDERLTTAQAERSLRDRGLNRAARKERRDVTAAQILLQSFLDARARGA